MLAKRIVAPSHVSLDLIHAVTGSMGHRVAGAPRATVRCTMHDSVRAAVLRVVSIAVSEAVS